jgi:acetyl-CoA acetyltransferase
MSVPGSKSSAPRVAVLGWAMSAIGEHPGRGYLDLLIEVIVGAAADAGVGLEEVDGLYVTPDDFGAHETPMLATRLPEILGISPRTLGLVECGGVTGALAIKTAVQDLRAGAADLAVVAAGSRGALSALRGDPRVFFDHLLYAQSSLLGPWILPYAAGAPVPLYAMVAQRYMHEYGIKAETVAALPVVLRRNAAANPKAQFRDPITVEDVLASKLICPPIHLLEACPISEGAGALVLASEEAARRVARGKGVWVTGMGEWHTPTHFTPARGPVARFPAVARAGAECYATAGIRAEDVDVAEVYGVFAATELITYEELGFFPEGRAAAAVEEGATGPGDRPALNPSGGRLSLGHPPVATPILETIEVATQLAGLAGPRQVSPARVGLVQAEHGMVNGSLALVLEA